MRAAALVVCLLVPIAACGDDDDASPATTSTTPASTVGTMTTTTSAPTTTTTAPEGHRITVSFAGGEVAGGARDETVASGEQVHLEVTSDVEEEVHVHGFDLLQPVGPGVTAVFDFVADLPGIWEVELEGSGVQLLRLEVQG
jgi:hypothetical protein